MDILQAKKVLVGVDLNQIRVQSLIENKKNRYRFRMNINLTKIILNLPYKYRSVEKSITITISCFKIHTILIRILFLKYNYNNICYSSNIILIQ